MKIFFTSPVRRVKEIIKLYGSRNMTNHLDMGNNRIILVDTPVSSTDAATKGYIDTELTHEISFINAQVR